MFLSRSHNVVSDGLVIFFSSSSNNCWSENVITIWQWWIPDTSIRNLIVGLFILSNEVNKFPVLTNNSYRVCMSNDLRFYSITIMSSIMSIRKFFRTKKKTRIFVHSWMIIIIQYYMSLYVNIGRCNSMHWCTL